MTKPLKPGEQPTTGPIARRVHPVERPKIAASNMVARLSGITPEVGPDISYYSPELIQCTLPHSDPKTRDWIRRNGNYSLIISSGIDEHGAVIGVPYGSFPRLTLAHIITRVIAKHDRRIEFSNYFGAFLREVGFTGNHRGAAGRPWGRSTRDQLMRLLRANITFQYHEVGLQQERIAVQDVKVAPKFDLWFDHRNPEQGSIFESWIELSDDFYQSILRAPVPLRTDILKALRKSPLALDVYMWVSYRLWTMQNAGHQQLEIPIGGLQAQFGTGISTANYRQFRSELRHAFDKVAQYWQVHEGDKEKLLLNYEMHEGGLVLYRSPLQIVRNRPTKQDENSQILKTRTFDVETRKRAKQLAANWDLNYLTTEYFAWIEGKGITPTDPRPHFLGFIRSHVKRNGNG